LHSPPLLYLNFSSYPWLSQLHLSNIATKACWGGGYKLRKLLITLKALLSHTRKWPKYIQ